MAALALLFFDRGGVVAIPREGNPDTAPIICRFRQLLSLDKAGMTALVRKSPFEYSTPEHRSWTMSRIKAKHTKPEMLVRRLTHSLGFRYRLHSREVPGKPDLVFKKRRKAIFVHGCFWHRHGEPSCKLWRSPKSNLEYWGAKLERNVARDKFVQNELQTQGWHSLIIWECELKTPDAVAARIVEFLSS